MARLGAVVVGMGLAALLVAYLGFGWPVLLVGVPAFVAVALVVLAVLGWERPRQRLAEQRADRFDDQTRKGPLQSRAVDAGMYHFDDPFFLSRSSRISRVVLTLSAWPRYQAAEVLTAHRCSSSHSTVDPSENTTRQVSRRPWGKTPVTTVISPVGLMTSSPTPMAPIRLKPLGVSTSEWIG